MSSPTPSQGLCLTVSFSAEQYCYFHFIDEQTGDQKNYESQYEFGKIEQYLNAGQSSVMPVCDQCFSMATKEESERQFHK